MAATARDDFDRRYQTHLKLQGLQPKTIEAYSRGIRRMGEYFDRQIDERHSRRSVSVVMARLPATMSPMR